MLSHVDENGQPRMVDVGAKAPTERLATAVCEVGLPENVAALIESGDLHGPKGPVFQTARIAGTMAVKKTHELIPFCHPLAIERCKLDIEPREGGVLLITCTVGLHGKTGVEMEALTGATVAALTVYDMCKAISHDITIGPARLLEKSGGKSDVLRA
jgi:cyclic pyranopterin phosphate synthase